MQQFSKPQKTAHIALFFICCLFFIQMAFSQGETNNWYFGSNAGITFNGGTSPTAVTNGQLNTVEGCAALSDANGQLLFYTDGSTVYNRNHIQMQNGSGLMGNSSSAQSAIIIPKPGSSTHFYIITVPITGTVGMRYSEVDMTLDSLRGGVLSGNKNTLMFSPSSEKVTAVKHSNGLHYWVIGRENGSSKKYVAFLIDCNGVNLDSVVSNVGITSGENWGYLVASPNGSRLASASSSSGIEITNFNTSTGVVSNPVNLGTLNYASYTGGNYGLAFSPNGNRLYATSITNWALVQWDLTAANISGSKTFIGYTIGNGTVRPQYRGGALQLGPDGKIYVAETGKSSLGVIANPDVVGTGCGFDTAEIGLATRICGLGLPPFVQSYFYTTALITYSGNCSGLNIAFAISSNASLLDSVKWNFGDPASGANNISSLDSPSHIFSADGTYNVQLIRYIDCITDTAMVTVNVMSKGILASISQSNNCGTTATMLTANPGGMNTYTWSVPVGTTNPGNSRVVSNAGQGSYSLTTTDVGGCSATATFNIDSTPPAGTTGVWPKQSTGGSADAETILADADTNVYVGGTYFGTVSFPSFGTKIGAQSYIMKLGECPWFVQLPKGAARPTSVEDFALDTDGNLIATGVVKDKLRYIIRLDKDSGTELSHTYITEMGSYDAHALAVSHGTGNIYSTGRYAVAPGNMRLLVLKLDSTLNILERDSFDFVGGQLDGLYKNGNLSIALDASDNLYVPVNMTSANIFAGIPLSGASVLKYNANLGQATAVDLSSFDKVTDLKVNHDTLYVMGATATPAPIVAKLNVGLTVLVSLPLTSYSDFWGTACDVDDSCIYFTLLKNDLSEAVIQKRNKYSGASNYLSIHAVSASGYVWCESVSVSKGVLYLAGKFEGQIDPPSGTLSSSGDAMFVARLDWLGQSFKTDGSEEETSLLEQPVPQGDFDAWIFPNPGSGQFRVKLSGGNKNKKVYLQIWDARGALVRNQQFESEEGIVGFDLNDCAPGIYMTAIKNGTDAIYRKVTLAP